MFPQFVDLNGDGHTDILTATYEGCVWWVRGCEKGFDLSERLEDKDFSRIGAKKPSLDNSSDGARFSCQSVQAVDWDNDGDLDLLLGCYDNGKILFRRNEGTATEFQFATKNEVVLAANRPMTVSKGVTGIRIADWNRDGLFDIVVAGANGGVGWFPNVGQNGSPKFGEYTELIPVSQFDKRQAAEHGDPREATYPQKTLYVDVLDFDRDGDLDLLVSGVYYLPEQADNSKSNQSPSANQEAPDVDQAATQPTVERVDAIWLYRNR